MKLYEFWRNEYIRDSYLTHLSDKDLSIRARYLIENITTLELNGKIGLRDISREPGSTLMRKFTHVVQEFESRNEWFEYQFLKGASIPEAMLGKEKSLTKLNDYARSKKPHLIKFGKKAFLEKLSLKVSLASAFLDQGLNMAQADDELKVIYTLNPKGIQLSRMDGSAIEGLLSAELIHEASSDYYIFCTAYEFDVRLFGDFEADACLFIYDSRRFSDHLFEKVANAVDILDHGYKPVIYFDPINPVQQSSPNVEFYKHIKYLYQNEFRHVFIADDQRDRPKHLYITMAEAEEYTELICL